MIKIVGVAVLLVLAACGRDAMRPGSADGETERSAHLNGSFRGDETGVWDGRAFTDFLTLALNQTGNDVLGGFQSRAVAAGTLRGRVQGAELHFTVEVEANCQTEFLGSARLSADGQALNGSYRGHSPCLGQVEASFGLARIR